MGSFEDLLVWQRAVELSVAIYLNTKELRDFGFRDQITRAGLSIPSNIAEGIERSTTADIYKFLDYARGSCGEVRTQTIVGIRAHFINDEIGQFWCQETKEIVAMLQGLIRSLREKKG